MIQMRAVIIDDDQLNIELVENFCKKYTPFVEVVGTAESVEEGIQELIDKKPDVLFLDMQINNLTGFDVLEAIHQPELMVIMITAYEKFAVKAFSYDVMHYLLKPLRIADFTNALEKCKQVIEKKNLTIWEQRPHELKFLSVPNQHLIDVIQIDTILHLEAQGTYTMITTMDNEQILATRGLNYYEPKLPAALFQRVHNSHIINLKGIVKVERSRNGNIFLKHNIEVPVAERKRKELMDRLS